MGTEKSGSGPGRNGAAHLWVALLAVVAVMTGLLVVYSAVIAALFGGVLPLVLTVVVWLVLLGTPAALLGRSRHRVERLDSSGVAPRDGRAPANSPPPDET